MSVVDNDRQELRSLRRDQPVTIDIEGGWEDYGRTLVVRAYDLYGTDSDVSDVLNAIVCDRAAKLVDQGIETRDLGAYMRGAVEGLTVCEAVSDE